MTLSAGHLDDAAARLAKARRVVVFTGAGVSAASGIPTFRDDTSGQGALWTEFPPEEFASPGALARLLVTDPARLVRFLRAVLEPVARAAPNAGHTALRGLEEQVVRRGGELTLVTQNVDGLHQAAGSSRVLEVHGSLLRVVDAAGVPLRELSRADLVRVVDGLAAAERGWFRRGRIVRALAPVLGLPRDRSLLPSHRPDVVLFGEALPERTWERAVAAARRADALLVVGTSGLVYPAATLPELAREAGATLIGVDPVEGDADVWLTAPAADALPRLVERSATLSP